MIHRSLCNVILGFLTIPAVLSLSALAQPGRRLDSPSNRSLVTIVDVVPGMTDEWLSLQRNIVIPELKKAGVKTRTVYKSGVFGAAYRYTITQPLNKFADFDSPDMRAAALGLSANPQAAERLRKCVSSTASFLSTALPDLSNPGESDKPPFVQLVRLRIAPGKLKEYEDVYKRDVLPALKKANSYVEVASRRLGTDGGDLVFETPMTRFADLDAPPPLLRAQEPQELAKLMAKLNDLATVVENTIMIRESDLSF